MALLIAELLEIRLVAVISGGDWAQFERQLLAHLPAAGQNFARAMKTAVDDQLLQ